MKPIALSILALAFLATAAFGGSQPLSRKSLSSKDDSFYTQFGGRVFHLYCQNRQLFVWKRADGQAGMYDCQTGQISPNAKVVRRQDGRWVSPR